MSQDLFDTLEALIDASMAGQHTALRRIQAQGRRQGIPTELLSKLVEAMRPSTRQIRRPISESAPLLALARTLGLAVMSIEGDKVRVLSPEAMDCFAESETPESMTPGHALCSFAGLSEAEANRCLHEVESTFRSQNQAARLLLIQQDGITFAIRNIDSKSDSVESQTPIIDALPVLDEVLLAQRERAEHKRVTIEFHADQQLDVHARTEDIRAIASNIIANAVDAAPTGTEIRVTALCDRNDVEFRVTDQGQGMNKEIRRRAFEPFFSTKNSAGLGLPTVRHLVTRLSGTLELETQVTAGTSVSIRLPRVQAR